MPLDEANMAANDRDLQISKACMEDVIAASMQPLQWQLNRMETLLQRLASAKHFDGLAPYSDTLDGVNGMDPATGAVTEDVDLWIENDDGCKADMGQIDCSDVDAGMENCIVDADRAAVNGEFTQDGKAGVDNVGAFDTSYASEEQKRLSGGQRTSSTAPITSAVSTLLFKNEMAKVVNNGKEMDARIVRAILFFENMLKRWESDRPPRPDCLSQLAVSPSFEFLCMLVILFNSVFIAVLADWEMNHIGKDQPQGFAVAEVCFICYFALEVLLRLWAYGWYFFFNREKAWNIFDMILVFNSIIDIILSKLMHESGGYEGNMTFMRILRLVRLTKIFRAFRTLKFFKELGVMMDSFKRSFMTMYWSLIMLALSFFMFALLFLQGLADYVSAESAKKGGLDNATLQSVNLWFGSMGTAVLTLYKAVTGGDDWSQIYDVVTKAGTFYGVIFVLFTFFFTFQLFNILTGLLVEKANAAAAPDRKEMIMAHRKKAHQDAQEFGHLCELLDSSKTGMINWSDFQRMMQNEVFVTYMASVGLEVHDIEIFFHTIGGSMDCTVSIEQFVHGCMHMRGFASSIDMQKCLVDLTLIIGENRRYQKEQIFKIERLEDTIGKLQRVVATRGRDGILSDDSACALAPALSDCNGLGEGRGQAYRITQSL